MRTPGEPSTVSAILHQLCPRCREATIFPRSVFAGIPKMHERCPGCGLKFEREQGYFLGAMYISYAIALLIITIFAVLLWAFTRWSIERVVIAAFLIFLPLAVPVTLFSRVLWIYLDRTIDPE